MSPSRRTLADIECEARWKVKLEAAPLPLLLRWRRLAYQFMNRPDVSQCRVDLDHEILRRQGVSSLELASIKYTVFGHE